MINKENSVINSTTLLDNLIYNPTKYNFADYNFVFGLGSDGSYADSIYDSSYFDLNMQQVTQTK